MMAQSLQLLLETITTQYPVACAHMEGSSEIHHLEGDVYLYPFLEGTLLVADIYGIPFSGFYGFHIHDHGPCVPEEGYTGFYDIGGHYNPTGQPHPFHAGDFPVLMSMNGHAFMIVYSDRLRPEEALGRAMAIHEWPDDYTSQPGGGSGRQIACGVFYPCCR
ncbi:MAG: superoxide dismutase family protein [Anaerovoracaceae bacterium]|jgi:Cu-Zn family superoxide dismutase